MQTFGSIFPIILWLGIIVGVLFLFFKLMKKSK